MSVDAVLGANYDEVLENQQLAFRGEEFEMFPPTDCGTLDASLEDTYHEVMTLMVGEPRFFSATVDMRGGDAQRENGPSFKEMALGRFVFAALEVESEIQRSSRLRARVEMYKYPVERGEPVASPASRVLHLDYVGNTLLPRIHPSLYLASSIYPTSTYSRSYPRFEGLRLQRTYKRLNAHIRNETTLDDLDASPDLAEAIVRVTGPHVGSAIADEDGERVLLRVGIS